MWLCIWFGSYSQICYSFAYFASTGFTSVQLYPCTMEATQVLESLGFLVRALVSDGASPNRKFYNIVSESVDSFYFTQNPFDRRRRIYLISDVPHLLKTTGNCFKNSCWDKNTRNLHVCFSLYLRLAWAVRKDLKRFLGCKWKNTVLREKWGNTSIF